MTTHLIAILAPLDWIVIVLFLVIILSIGLYYRNQAKQSLEAFFLGGRNLPWWIAGTSMVATTFAADTPLAITEFVAESGIAGNWIWWNMLAGGLLTTFFFAKLWRRANIMTDVEFIEIRYAGQAAKILRVFKALYLGLFMNCLIIGWVNLALVTILEVFFELSPQAALNYTALLMLLVMLYASMSGLLGVAITDTLQFVVAMVGCLLLAIFVVNDEKIGGIAQLKASLPAEAFNFFPQIQSTQSLKSSLNTLSIGLGSFLAYISIWWTSWYPGAEPGGGGYIAQRIMSTRDESHAIKATLFFQIAHYAIRPWPWIIVGLCSLVLYPELGADEKRLGFVYAMRDFLPVGLKGLLLVAFLAAYMSTVSTQLNWGASYLVGDIYKRLIRPVQRNKNEKHYVVVSKITTGLIALIALGVTTQLKNISSVWEFIIECGAGLGLVLILRWYWWRINAWSEITATVVPFVAYALAKFSFEWVFPNSFFFTVGVTTVSWLLVTFITSPTPQDTLLSFYKRVRPQGAWQPIRVQLKDTPQGASVLILLACWICSVIIVYAALFAVGSFILLQWEEGLLYCFLILLASIGLSIAAKKHSLF
ncbi:MAG: sodium:solute symporter family protein [Thermonemataceae bacterium]